MAWLQRGPEGHPRQALIEYFLLAGSASVLCFGLLFVLMGQRVPVLVDGGVRRGTDILRALALGAQAVCIGRPVLWGLAAAGQPGVERVLRLLMEEFSLAMALAGCSRVSEITSDLIHAKP